MTRSETRVDALNVDLHAIRFHVDTYSPGDGMTRYRFFRAPGAGTSADPIQVSDYFTGYGVFTALGWKECQTFAAGLFVAAPVGGQEGEE